jgi:lysophospholipase L1-like esterase
LDKKAKPEAPPMQTVSLDRIAPLFDGHVDLRRRGGSIQPLRIPAAEALLYDPFNRWVASAAAGVRLRFITGSRRVGLTTTQRLVPATPPAFEPRGLYDLFVDGALAARGPAEGGAIVAPDGALEGDEAARLVFDDLPAGEKHIELWLPQSATVSVTGLEIDDGADLRPWLDPRPRILFHGSSITHCMEAAGASAGWPAVAAELAGLRHINLGWGGSCLLSGLAARIIRDQPADAIVLKLGINVWPDGALRERTFLDSAHAMLSIIREGHAVTPVVVVSPIYSPGREDAGDNGGLSLTRMRDLLAEAVDTRVRMGDAALRYLSGLDLFGDADAADLPDDLHPNTAGYRRMGERFCAQMLSGTDALVKV